MEPTEGHTLLDTYRGVYISVDYVIFVELKRPLLGKDLVKQVEFIVEAKVKYSLFILMVQNYSFILVT